MIFPVVILIGSLAPVISIALLLLLSFVFVLNVLGLWRFLLVIDSSLAPALPGPFASLVPRPAGLQTVSNLSLGALISVAPPALGRSFLFLCLLQTVLLAVLSCCRLGRSNTPTGFQKKRLTFPLGCAILEMRKRLR